MTSVRVPTINDISTMKQLAAWFQNLLAEQQRRRSERRRQRKERWHREHMDFFDRAVEGAASTIESVNGFPNMAKMIVGNPDRAAGDAFPFDVRDVSGAVWKKVMPGISIRRFDAVPAHTAYGLVCGYYVTIIFELD